MSRDSTERFSLRQRMASFRFALAGLRQLIREEHNARVHLLAGSVAIAAALLLQLSRLEWLLLIITIGLVFMAEAFNTAVELLCDHVTPEHHATIGSIKDMAAAAVLIISVVAVVVGLLIFIPALLRL